MSIMGTCTVETSARVNGRLDVRLNGVSELGWLGEPVMGDIRTSGVSKMKKLG